MHAAPPVSSTTEDLLRFIHASPTPRHCVAECARRLDDAGFAALSEGTGWTLEPEAGYYIRAGGTLVAFRVGRQPAAEAGFRLLGAHTDSPNLRVKPLPDVHRHGCYQLGVDVYGGALDYTWLDRDLGLAGVVVLREPGGRLRERLLRVDRPVARVPSLAIHLNREIRDKGLKLNAQQHLPVVLGLDSSEEAAARALSTLLAEALGEGVDAVAGWDLSLFDVQPPAVGGLRSELVFAPRLDNQAMCHAALLALLRASAAGATQVVALFDHEEAGSESAEGAGGDVLRRTLSRIAESEGPGAVTAGLARAAARSFLVSADMAHAVHPNYADRSEPEHAPRLNGGPVIKINRNLRYATSALTEARFAELCQQAEVPVQRFVNRADLACGSTIGPISAARLGVPTVDVGNSMWAMHSIRETTGAEDPERMVRVMALALTR